MLDGVGFFLFCRHSCESTNLLRTNEKKDYKRSDDSMLSGNLYTVRDIAYAVEAISLCWNDMVCCKDTRPQASSFELRALSIKKEFKTNLL